jgi:SAM-dependent methyltransferase
MRPSRRSPLPATPLVLDTGCGSGEVLLRSLKTHPSARGLGVDRDADAIAEARHRANRSLARFEVRYAAAIEGRFDAVIKVGSSHAHRRFPGALTALGDAAPVVLYGEGSALRDLAPVVLYGEGSTSGSSRWGLGAWPGWLRVADAAVCAGPAATM